MTHPQEPHTQEDKKPAEERDMADAAPRSAADKPQSDPDTESGPHDAMSAGAADLAEDTSAEELSPDAVIAELQAQIDLLQSRLESVRSGTWVQPPAVPWSDADSVSYALSLAVGPNPNQPSELTLTLTLTLTR